METIAERIYPLLEGKSDITKLEILLEVMKKDNEAILEDTRAEERNKIKETLLREIKENEFEPQAILDFIKSL